MNKALLYRTKEGHTLHVQKMKTTVIKKVLESEQSEQRIRQFKRELKRRGLKLWKSTKG